MLRELLLNAGNLVSKDQLMDSIWPDLEVVARHSGLAPDDVIVRHAAARYTVAMLGFAPHEVMMVAAHRNDLQGARAAGLRTALVTRPHEYGADGKPDLEPDPGTDIFARNFLDLADQITPALPDYPVAEATPHRYS